MGLTDKHETVYSEVSDQETFSEINEKKTSIKSQKSNDYRRLYAAIRLFVGKGDVNIISVNQIKEFDETRSHYPYNAYVANGFNENDEIIYEPASILAISNDENALKNRSTRWPKPNLRRSTVIHELAQEALKKEKVSAKKSEKMTDNTSKKALLQVKPQEDYSVKMKDAQRRTKEKINVLDKKKLNFDLVKKERSVSPLRSRTRNRTTSTATLASTQKETDNLSMSPSLGSRKRKRIAISSASPAFTQKETVNLSMSPCLGSRKCTRTVISSTTPTSTQKEIDNLSVSPSLTSRAHKRIIPTATPALTHNQTDTDYSVSPSLTSRTRKRIISTATPALTHNETDTDNSVSPSLTSRTRKRIISTAKPAFTSEKTECTATTSFFVTPEEYSRIHSVSPDVKPEKLAQESLFSTPRTSRNSKSKSRQILTCEDNAVVGPSGYCNKTKKCKPSTVTIKRNLTNQFEKKASIKGKQKIVFMTQMTIITPGWKKRLNSQNGRIPK